MSLMRLYQDATGLSSPVAESSIQPGMNLDWITKVDRGGLDGFYAHLNLATDPTSYNGDAVVKSAEGAAAAEAYTLMYQLQSRNQLRTAKAAATCHKTRLKHNSALQQLNMGVAEAEMQFNKGTAIYDLKMGTTRGEQNAFLGAINNAQGRFAA